MSAASLILCDDHPLLIRGLADLIAGSSRFRIVATCGDGVHGLSAICALRPDLAVIDIAMPKMNGLELFVQARAAGWTGRGVLLTAAISDQETVHAVAAGVNGIVLKEAAGATLIDALEAVLAGQRWMPPDIVQAAVSRARANRDNSPLAMLTPREREVALMIADGRSNREAASALGLSEGTIKTYVRTIFEKLGADNRTAVALLIARAGGRNELNFRR